MRKVFFATIFCMHCFIGICQEILSPVVQAKFITRFPFKQYSGGVMIVRATLGNHTDSLNFILDTGSGGISLDSTTADRLGVIGRQSDTTITGMGIAHKVKFAFDQQLHFPGLSIDKLNFHFNNYNVLTSVYGEKIDGIIGYSFFSRYIVKINSDSSQIEVFNSGEIRYPRMGIILRPAFTTLPIQNLTVRDGRQIDFNFFLDTGAGLCFLMSEAFAKDSAVLFSRRKPIPTQGEGMGGRLSMGLTVVKMLHVGRYKFRNVPTYIFEDEYNVTSYPFVGGLLGNDLMRRFNMILNYPNREIHIVPNSHFLEPFDYAYTGMAMYFINGTILIEDVIKGSPADKAGARVDDILIGVGNNFTNNIMQYKTMLQSANEKIRMVISRSGKLMELKIKPTSIF